MGMVMQRAEVPPADEALVEKVAQALRTLEDEVLTAIGASSTAALGVLSTAARKVDRERVTRRGYEQQRDDISRELDQMRDRLASVEVELTEARRDRSMDDWTREQRVNKLRAEESELRGRLVGHEKALRSVIDLVGGKA